MNRSMPRRMTRGYWLPEMDAPSATREKPVPVVTPPDPLLIGQCRCGALGYQSGVDPRGRAVFRCQECRDEMASMLAPESPAVLPAARKPAARETGSRRDERARKAGA